MSTSKIVAKGINADYLTINEDVFIGDWILLAFKEKFYVGLVLSFSYLNGKTQRAKEFSRNYASVKPPDGKDKVKPLGFLCSYFRYDNDGTLIQECRKPSYISLNSYKATVAAPSFENGSLRVSKTLVERIIVFQGYFLKSINLIMKIKLK